MRNTFITLDIYKTIVRKANKLRAGPGWESVLKCFILDVICSELLRCGPVAPCRVTEQVGMLGNYIATEPV